MHRATTAVHGASEGIALSRPAFVRRRAVSRSGWSSPRKFWQLTTTDLVVSFQDVKFRISWQSHPYVDVFIRCLLEVCDFTVLENTKKCFCCWIRRSHYHLPLVPRLQPRLIDSVEWLYLLRIFMQVIRGYFVVILPFCAPSHSLLTKIVIVGIISLAFPTPSEEPVNADNDSRRDHRSPEYLR